MVRLIIFASGSGSNAENLIHFFNKGDEASVQAVFTNNANAGVIQRAKNQNVPVEIFDRSQFTDREQFLLMLEKYQPDIIILAGFLWLIPDYLIQAFPNRILNIHPALLPKYGGKGMYGDRVHRAVLSAKERVHGVTVHLIDENYDEGEILLQESFTLGHDESLESITEKIHSIEFRIFPRAIQLLIQRITKTKKPD